MPAPIFGPGSGANEPGRRLQSAESRGSAPSPEEIQAAVTEGSHEAARAVGADPDDLMDHGAVGAKNESSLIERAKAEHDANTAELGAAAAAAELAQAAFDETPTEHEARMTLEARLLRQEEQDRVDQTTNDVNRYEDLAEQVGAFDDALNKFQNEDEDASESSTPSPRGVTPDAVASAQEEREQMGRPKTSEGRRKTAAEEIQRLKQEEAASVKAVMEAASNRFYSGHRMHRTYLLHCFRDERLKIAPKRLGEVLGSVAADWMGMTDDERSLRSDFEMRDANAQGVLSGHAGGAHGLRRGTTRHKMAELNQITRGVQAFVRPEGPLAQRAMREAHAAGAAAWYPQGGERLLLTMSDLELAVQDVLVDTPFQRAGVSKKQAALMMCQHPETLLLYLQHKYFPVKQKDVLWMIKHSVRHWLQLAAEFEVTDYEADRMRQLARDQRDEVRQVWAAARTRQNEAMGVVQQAKVLAQETDELREAALQEREEMVEARIEMAREKMEAEEAKMALSKEVTKAGRAFPGLAPTVRGQLSRSFLRRSLRTLCVCVTGDGGRSGREARTGSQGDCDLAVEVQGSLDREET
jgi:hypothetical protein